VYLLHTAAAYVGADADGLYVATPLPGADPDNPNTPAGAAALGVPLSGAPPGVSLRAEALLMPPAASGRDDPDAMLPPPMLRVAVEHGGKRGTVYLPLAPYAGYAHAVPVELPGVRPVYLAFARARRELPAALHVRRATRVTFPASGVVKDYRCEVEIAAGGHTRRDVISLNHPVDVGPWQISQASWHPPGQAPTELDFGVRTRPGMPVIWTGCILIVLGFSYAFYVKPLILRRRGACR